MLTLNAFSIIVFVFLSFVDFDLAYLRFKKLAKDTSVSTDELTTSFMGLSLRFLTYLLLLAVFGILPPFELQFSGFKQVLVTTAAVIAGVAGSILLGYHLLIIYSECALSRRQVIYKIGWQILTVISIALVVLL